MSTPLAAAWQELGDLTGPPGPSGPTPGRRLNIGRLAGQNHFAVQVAVDGAATIETHDQDDIAGGYDAIPYYTLLADESAVQMRASVGGPTTSGTTYTRCEHRELDLDGRPIAFNPFVNTHRLWGRHRITHLPPNKPEVVIAQLHNGAADRVAIRTQVISGQTKLLCRVNGSAVTPRFAEPYLLGTWFDWMIEVVDGQLRVYYNDLATPLITSSALTPTVGGPTWYFKAGVYLQSDTATDLASEYGSVDMASLGHWHTGWPEPRNRAGTARHAAQHAPGGPDPLRPVIVDLGDIAAGATITPVSGTASLHRARLLGATATLGPPTAAGDGDVVNVEVHPTLASTLTIAPAIVPTGGLAASVPLTAGKVWAGALRYRAVAPAGWRLLASGADN